MFQSLIFEPESKVVFLADFKNCAIISFTTDAIAHRVLYTKDRAAPFILRGKQLDVKRHQPKTQTTWASSTTQTGLKPSSVSFQDTISHTYYGNLISPIALKNIERSDSNVRNTNKLAIIAHQLAASVSMHFRVDAEAKKIQIIMKTRSTFMLYERVKNELKLEWSFEE